MSYTADKAKLQTVVHKHEQLAPAICPCIFSAGEYWLSAKAAPPDLCWSVASSLKQERLHNKWGIKYAGENSWSHMYLQRVLYHVMDTLISGWTKVANER